MNDIKFEKENRDWTKLTITNRFMFNKVFTNNPDACRRLLEILLGIKIGRIEPPKGEYTIEGNIENHAVKLDIYTENGQHLYDIEMQTTSEADLPERAHYYQSMMDTDSLEAGKPYGDLKNSIVIFICAFDPFSRKKPRYEFRNLDIDDGNELGDRTRKIFFNVKEYDKIKEDKELKGLLKFFCENKAETDFTDSLESLVNTARKNERWRQDYMTYERWEYYTKQAGIREGMAYQKAEDEKIFAEKENLLNLKESENARLASENEMLKAKIAELTRNRNA